MVQLASALDEHSVRANTWSERGTVDCSAFKTVIVDQKNKHAWITVTSETNYFLPLNQHRNRCE